jgi:hypothetical protein
MTSTATIDHFAIKQEVVHFLRNNDVLPVATRGVTTTAGSGSLSAATTLTINDGDVRNIRSLEVGGVELDYGSDYTVDFYYNDGGTRKCRITFTTAQTGAYDLSYDTGTDRIFPDFPQDVIAISDYPRIGVDIVGVVTNVGGFGNVLRNRVSITVVVYSTSRAEIAEVLTNVRQSFRNAYSDFYYLGGYVRPQSTGPVIVSGTGRQKVFHQNADFTADFRLEK